MITRHFFRNIMIRIILLLGLSIAGSYLLFVMKQVLWSLLVFLLALVMVGSTIKLFNRVNRWIASFLLGIENEDSTLHVPEETGNKTINEIFRRIKRLNELYRNKNIEIGVQEQYYLSIINQSATGLFSVNEEGRIMNINPAAEKLIGLIAYQHVNSLRRISDALPGFIRIELKPGESPSAIFESPGGEKLLFKLSEISTPDEAIRLVVVSDISKELDIREVDAWIKLARTLSHEIMNNIAPITTLSQVTLDYFVKNNRAVDVKEIDQDMVHETIKGLKVIEERSSGLTEFVENYRRFTKLPEPVLKKVKLHKLIASVLTISAGFERFDQVRVEDQIPVEVTVLTDQNLLSQVLINLIKNALESFNQGVRTPHPYIRVIVKEEADRVRIDICNNGELIPHELREQIFVPFFTTKENGSGIGLSLSKQIMLLLGGDINLRSNSKNETCFRITIKSIRI